MSRSSIVSSKHGLFQLNSTWSRPDTIRRESTNTVDSFNTHHLDTAYEEPLANAPAFRSRNADTCNCRPAG